MANKYGDSTPLNTVVQLIGPEDLSEGASASLWVSMRDYRYAEVHIFIGDLAGAASAVSLDQATDNSGTGTKTLGFTKYYITGQRLGIDAVSATKPVAGDVVTGVSSTNTATVIKVRSDELIIGFLTNSTTWTDNEDLTFTAGATASANGTGSDEDILVEKTAASDTFNTIAVTFKHYMIPLDDTMLDVANGFDHFQLDMGDASASETQGCAFAIMFAERYGKYPQQSTLGTQKIV